jgi:TolB-like protein
MKTLPRGFVAVVAALACVLALAPAARAEGKTRVAVKSFAAKGVDNSVAGTLETSFCSALSNQSMEVLCPDDIKALISAKQAELGLGKCDSDEECVKSIANVAHAAKVVTGEVSKLGESYILSVSIIDAENGKVLTRASDKTSKLEELLDKVEGLAKKLAAAK